MTDASDTNHAHTCERGELAGTLRERGCSVEDQLDERWREDAADAG